MLTSYCAELFKALLSLSQPHAQALFKKTALGVEKRHILLLAGCRSLPLRREEHASRIFYLGLSPLVKTAVSVYLGSQGHKENPVSRYILRFILLVLLTSHNFSLDLITVSFLLCERIFTPGFKGA